MPLEAGHRIGVYEILERVGAGGMGEIYRARDTRLGRPVAIKFVAADHLTDTVATERLQREAKLASSLNHPGIVTIHDVGIDDGRAFIVMELVEGQTVGERLKRGRLPMREALDIATQVADALAAAHQAGVVHRDLKPDNIMLTPDGRAKVVDFGLSKITARSGANDLTRLADALTAEHAILGSAGYMAPEQVTGQAVDHRADQFALGVVIYEMCCGRRAFQRDTAVQTMAAILDSEPVPITELCADLPASAATVIERCLAKQPDHRYASTLDLARDLHDSVRAAAAAAPAPAPGGARWLWPAIAIAAIAAIVVVAFSLRGRTPAAAPGQDTLRQIVVLPFANVTRDGNDQVFCDGLVETLTSSLTQLERFQRTLRVVPASEVRRDGIDSAKAARSAFGATLAISGSLQRSGSTLRLTLNLVDATELRQLASRTLDVTGANATATQDAIVNAATALLDLQLAPAARTALTAGGTSVPAAYDAYVRARGYLQRFDRVENIDHAIELLASAIAADGRYALAHAALGEALWRKYEREKQSALIDRAVKSCSEALAIDERLAPVHVTLALIARGRGRYEEAAAAATRALELDAVNSDAYRELGRAHEALNRFQEAENTYRKAIDARPDDWQAFNTLGSFYYARGRFADAEAAYQRAVALTPDNTRPLNNLGTTYAALRQYDNAIATWERSASIRPTAVAVSNLGTMYFEQARYADAARTLERAVALTPNDYRLWRNLGAALAATPGQREKARTAYEEAVRLGEQMRQVNPRQAELLAHLADAYASLGRRAEAVDAAAALERLNPQEAPVFVALASVYEQTGDRARALVWVEKAIGAGYDRARIERSPSLAELIKDKQYLSNRK